MPPTAKKETFVCFANSRKLNGRCIAGLRWDGTKCSTWIRPISALEHGELIHERFYSDGKDPELLDIIELGLLSPRIKGCHTEDVLVAPGDTWTRRGSITFREALAFVSKPVGPLWFNGKSTYHGENDSIPAKEAHKLGSSLILIRPKSLTLTCTDEGYQGKMKKKVRGSFTWGKHDYKLSVTDPVIEAEFATLDVGKIRDVEAPILCVSVGEKFDKQNAHYKLIAGVLED